MITRLALLVPLLASSTLAFPQTPPRDEKPPVPKEKSSDQNVKALPVYPLNEMIGAKVTNAEKERMGTIEDVVLRSNGDVGYAVLSFGDDKLFAVPWSVLKISSAPDAQLKENLITLPVGQERLKQAPGFDKKAWPNMNGTAWLRQVDEFYAGEARAEKRPAEAGLTAEPVIFKASNLKGMKVDTASGETIGTIEEIVVDPAMGHVNYVALGVGRYLGTGEKIVAMPWTTLKVTKTGEGEAAVGKLTSDIGKERLANAPEFKAGKENWPAMASPDMQKRVREHYNAEAKKPAGENPKREPPKN